MYTNFFGLNGTKAITAITVVHFLMYFVEQPIRNPTTFPIWRNIPFQDTPSQTQIFIFLDIPL